MSHKVELNIYHLINRLEAIKGRRISDNEIATALGVHRHTVTKIRKGRPEPSLAKLLDYFAAEGMPVTVDQLFTVTTPPTG